MNKFFKSEKTLLREEIELTAEEYRIHSKIKLHLENEISESKNINLNAVEMKLIKTEGRILKIRKKYFNLTKRFYGVSKDIV